MDRHLRTYLDSFKVPGYFWSTFLIDVLFFGLFWQAFSRFSRYLENKNVEILGGRSVEQIQQLLVGSPEQALPYVQQLQSYLLSALGGLAVLAIAAFLLFSLAQGLIWNLLHQKKLTAKTYWRWNALQLALIIPLLLYALAAQIVKLMVTALLGGMTRLSPAVYLNNAVLIDALLLTLDKAVSLLLLLLALTILFLIYYQFAQHYRVWSSIGRGLSLVKTHWASIWRMILLMATTAVLPAFMLIPLQKAFFLYPTAETILIFAVSLLFLAWMRFYMVRVIHGHPASSAQ